MSYRFTSAALHELREAVLYYETAENGLGGSLMKSKELLPGFLQHPKRGECSRGGLAAAGHTDFLLA